MELKKDKIVDKKQMGMDGSAQGKKKVPFATKAVLLGALALAPAAGCTPDVNVTVTPYDPNAPDAGAQCIGTCEGKSGVLREPGNTAGVSEMDVGGAVLRFKGLVDEGSTKAATLELEGCEGEKPTDNLKPGENTTLTLNSGESAQLTVEAMEYDGAGLMIEVSVVPLCGDADGGAGGAGGDGGAGGSG